MKKNYLFLKKKTTFKDVISKVLMESKFTFIVTNDYWVGVSVCAHIYVCTYVYE